MWPRAKVDHAAAAARAEVDPLAGEHGAAFAIICGFDARNRGGNIERGANLREFVGAASVGEKAEVTDAPKTLGQNVQEKAAHELVGVERHRLGFAAGAIIFPSKPHCAIVAIEESAIGDGDAMRVAAEIVEHLLRAAKWPLRMDNPFGMAQRGEISGERSRRMERREVAEEL